MRRQIIGKVYKSDDTPWLNAKGNIFLINGAYTTDIQYPQSRIPYRTDLQGNIISDIGQDLYLWCNELGNIASKYKFVLPDGKYFEFTVPVGAAPSNNTNNFIIIEGFSNEIAEFFLHGVCFYYNHAVNSGNITAICRNNGNETSVDTGIPFTTNWMRKHIHIDKTGSLAQFFIDDVEVASITTNIPNTSGSKVRPNIGIQSLAGLSNKSLFVDYFELVGQY